MDGTSPWKQVNISFTSWDQAEDAAAASIAPHLETGELVSAWWFIRKAPCWRIRYQPAGDGTQARLEQHLSELAAAGSIAGWTRAVYEPETRAFGGPEAMTAAHRLFHADSRAILAYLRSNPGGGHRREISLLLCSILLRAAQLDIYEQGDVWARVTDHRKPPPGTSPDRPSLLGPVRRLITADGESQMRDGAPLARCAQWAATYAAAGRELAAFSAAGQLHRGLRDILAHHVIFAWNRLGLPYTAQSALARTATTVIFGAGPALARPDGTQCRQTVTDHPA
jgi:thiopeptide-type bacteriocin biosynthesis protein